FTASVHLVFDRSDFLICRAVVVCRGRGFLRDAGARPQWLRRPESFAVAFAPGADYKSDHDSFPGGTHDDADTRHSAATWRLVPCSLACGSDHVQPARPLY